MSFYEKSNYNLSTHSHYRIKERLKLNVSDLELRGKVNEIISKSNYSWETSKTLYIQSNINDVYFVIDKVSNLIITATQISHQKQIEIIENEK
ncbi:hypothetical protein [Spiroplasma endosymbiont of Othius punctulatus]|uniref:hypothetical protein n=1 Tax=Spiroplasma endosymbiont of Othius punctulatus TaxID=3066289 RepID=UPI0030D25799